ncbi:hypothetical protein J437_LFUL002837 [Ladona fulva]|uniref:Phosphatidylserine synthase n=1 Tax=Ladona fulva TaxID=123851 RepID=A0A8K0NYJ5_LADFU|nr:hypothetical protein J437_LFUL002837 [Ladona fulva]
MVTLVALMFNRFNLCIPVLQRMAHIVEDSGRQNLKTSDNDSGKCFDKVTDDCDAEEKTDSIEWKLENEKRFSDDGTLSFFWRAHTLTVLLIFISVLVYVSMFEPVKEDTEYNIKRGLVACVLVFILLGVTVTPDGPFRRPHPALWRFAFCCSIVYELGIIFVLFQTDNDARKLLHHVDSKLGVPLEEKSYGGNCKLYDEGFPEDPFHNLWVFMELGMDPKPSTSGVSRKRKMSAIIKEDEMEKALIEESESDSQSENSEEDILEEEEVPNPGNNPFAYFTLLADDLMLNFILRETNIYGKEKLKTKWVDVSMEEFHTFLGVVYLTGIVRLPKIAQNPLPGEPKPEDPLYKVRNIVETFRNNMKKTYYPKKELSLDESMVMWRGRPYFRQYIQGKSHKYGIKIYMLSEPDGLVLNNLIYTGSRDKEVGGMGHTEKVVKKLLSDYENVGHAIYMDNFYNSPNLSLDLLKKKIFSTGTLRPSRKGVPKDVMATKLKKGECISPYNEEGLCVTKWKDRREVMTLSTEFGGDVVNVTNKRGKEEAKPEQVVHYNMHMGGIDRTELLSYYYVERRTLRWNIRVGLHFLELSLVNAYLLFNRFSGKWVCKVEICLHGVRIFGWSKILFTRHMAVHRMFLLAELNTFYLKFVLWVPPDHYLNLIRLILYILCGAVSVREAFQYLDDPDCTKIGRQSWILLSIVASEFLVVAKFGWDTITLPIPKELLHFYSIKYYFFPDLLLHFGWLDSLLYFFGPPGSFYSHPGVLVVDYGCTCVQQLGHISWLKDFTLLLCQDISLEEFMEHSYLQLGSVWILWIMLRGKLNRIIAQFGPYTWVDYDWKATSSLGRWISVLAIIFVKVQGRCGAETRKVEFGFVL